MWLWAMRVLKCLFTAVDVWWDGSHSLGVITWDAHTNTHRVTRFGLFCTSCSSRTSQLISTHAAVFPNLTPAHLPRLCSSSSLCWGRGICGSYCDMLLTQLIHMHTLVAKLTLGIKCTVLKAIHMINMCLDNMLKLLILILFVKYYLLC